MPECLYFLLFNDKKIRNSRDAATYPIPAFPAIQRARIEAQIDLLITTNDRSPIALQPRIYLQPLFATARPEKT